MHCKEKKMHEVLMSGEKYTNITNKTLHSLAKEQLDFIMHDAET